MAQIVYFNMPIQIDTETFFIVATPLLSDFHCFPGFNFSLGVSVSIFRSLEMIASTFMVGCGLLEWK